MAQKLTDQQIVECARKVLDSMRSREAGSPQSKKADGGGELKPGEWVYVSSIYTRLFAHPERFGAESVYALPGYPRFERVCRAMFATKFDEFDGEIMVRIQ